MYYKKGDILSRKEAVGVFKTAKVISDSVDSYYALEILEPTEDDIFPEGEIIVRSVGVLDDFYEKTDPFFKIGQVYKYKPSSWRDDSLRYHVLDLYTLDNPMYPPYKEIAVVKVVDADNEEAMTVLDLDDFKVMEKV